MRRGEESTAAAAASLHACICLRGRGEGKDDCGLSLNARKAAPPSLLPPSPKYLPLVPSGFLCIVCPLFMAVSWLPRRRRLTMRSLARSLARSLVDVASRGGGGEDKSISLTSLWSGVPSPRRPSLALTAAVAGGGCGARTHTHKRLPRFKGQRDRERKGRREQLPSSPLSLARSHVHLASEAL